MQSCNKSCTRSYPPPVGSCRYDVESTLAHSRAAGNPQPAQGSKKPVSVRRAESVVAELVHDDVPRNEIAMRSFGETNPLVPTAAGVREPQNRCVEIILH